MLRVRGPHDGQLLAEVSPDTYPAIDRKVRAARTAMAEWGRSGTAARANALVAVATGLDREVEDLSWRLSLEQGKPLRESRIEITRSAEQFRQYAGLAIGLGGRSLPLSDGVEGRVDRLPVGVVAAVVPWNFPISLLATKLAPALAAGCGVVAKPAESTPLVTQRVIELVAAELPDGLVGCVVGGATAGRVLVDHDDVARIAFTGSTATGADLARRAGSRFKRISLELGGCDPLVVREDADLDAAARAVCGTRYYNAGQVCVAPKRLIAHRQIVDAMVERITDRIARMRVGPGIEPDTRVGPLHTHAVRDLLEAQIADAESRGATLVGGGRPDDAELAAGPYVRPGVLLDVPSGARVRTEETFGPVLTVIPVNDDDEAVAVANETPFGLGASVWGEDLERSTALARRIDAGYRWVNSLARVYDELPFGGVKSSGVGREHGPEALDSYLEDHTLIVRHAREDPND